MRVTLQSSPPFPPPPPPKKKKKEIVLIVLDFCGCILLTSVFTGFSQNWFTEDKNPPLPIGVNKTKFLCSTFFKYCFLGGVMSKLVFSKQLVLLHVMFFMSSGRGTNPGRVFLVLNFCLFQWFSFSKPFFFPPLHTKTVFQSYQLTPSKEFHFPPAHHLVPWPPTLPINSR